MVKSIVLVSFTLKTRLAFTKLKQIFIKTPIFYYFNLEPHIWIEIDASNHKISRVFI